jgi:ADP-ribose pyrophosphatase YjhB (NUDIX family)
MTGDKWGPTVPPQTTAASVTLSARMLFHVGERVLVANKRGHDWFFLPGGNVRPGESVEDALRREIPTMTGMPVRTLDYVGCVEHAWVENGRTWQELNVIFASTLPRFGEIGSRSLDIDIDSVAVADLYAYEFRPDSLRDTILDWLAHRRPIWHNLDESVQPDGAGQT